MGGYQDADEDTDDQRQSALARSILLSDLTDSTILSEDVIHLPKGAGQEGRGKGRAGIVSSSFPLQKRKLQGGGRVELFFALQSSGAFRHRG